MADQILTRRQLAEHLDVTEDALAQMANRGTGPRFVKLSNRFVRYRMADVEVWLERNLVSSTRDRKPTGDAT